MLTRRNVIALPAAAGLSGTALAQPLDPVLPSWNPGIARSAIVSFVARVTSEGGADFVPPEQRIAVFDHDGTLWSEQPVYFQFAFARDQILRQVDRHPEWKREQPFKAILT